MTSCQGINQLGINPDSVPGLLNTALQHIPDAQFFTYLLDLHWLSLVGEGRISGDHKQVWNIRECGDDGFGDPIAKEFLFWITTHILKGQHGD